MMKAKNKKYFIVLLIFILYNTNLRSQDEKDTVNKYAFNAIKTAVVEYHEQKEVGYKKHPVVTLNLININQLSGEFILSHIYNNYEYSNLELVHYIRVNGEIVLVNVHDSCDCIPKQYGISPITDEIKNEVLTRLAGRTEDMSIEYNPRTDRADTLFRKRIIMGGPSPKMIFCYKKHKIKSLFYNYGSTPVYGKEYWRNWKLSLSSVQKSAKLRLVKDLNNSFHVGSAEKKGKDLLRNILKENLNLPEEIREQDVNKLTFIPVFTAKIESKPESFSDTVSIYGFIKPDTDCEQACQIIVLKKNRFWGLLTFMEATVEFKTKAEMTDNRFGRQKIDLYEKVLHKNPSRIFYMEYFGQEHIWYTRPDRIFVFFNYENYHNIEADEYIHRFYTKENIIKKMEIQAH